MVSNVLVVEMVLKVLVFEMVLNGTCSCLLAGGPEAKRFTK